MKLKNYCFIIGVTLLSCSSEDGHNNAESIHPGDSTSYETDKYVKQLYMLPTPLQVATIAKIMDIPYRPELVVPADGAGVHYETKFKKAVNMGVQGIDLGYCTMYGQAQQGIYYLNNIKRLSDELDISQGFNGPTVERFKNNVENRDSLCQIILEGFKQSHDAIKKNKKEEVGILIISGSFIEGLYLSSDFTIESPNQELINLLGIQKIYLTNIIELLSMYSGDAEIDTFLDDLLRLNELFISVNVSIKKVGKNGNVMSDVQISKDDIRKINKLVNSIRNKITA